MFLIAGRSGLRWGRTLEEGGPYVVVRCNSVALTWLIGDGSVDPLDKEEDGDEEEEGGGVMIGGVRKGEEQHRDKGCEEREKFPCADFWGRGHRWIECIALPELSLNTKAGAPPSAKDDNQKESAARGLAREPRRSAALSGVVRCFLVEDSSHSNVGIGDNVGTRGRERDRAIVRPGFSRPVRSNERDAVHVSWRAVVGPSTERAARGSQQHGGPHRIGRYAD